MNRIKNYVQLTSDIGTSGQPTESQFKLIADVGYTALINLAMSDHKEAIFNEGSIVTGLGMNYFHIPVPFDDPKPEHVRMFCNIMESLDGKNVWVHCIMNYRVSAFMFHYLNKIKKFSETESRSPMFQVWEPNDVWKNFINLTVNEIDLQ